MLLNMILTVAVLVLLAGLAVACTPTTEQPVPVPISAPAPVSAPVSAPASAEPSPDQVVIANDAVAGNAQAIVDWYNSLPGKSYQGRIIYRVDSISVVKGDRTVTIAFALVSLKNP